jgi:hypothetical protein
MLFVSRLQTVIRLQMFPVDLWQMKLYFETSSMTEPPVLSAFG